MLSVIPTSAATFQAMRESSSHENAWQLFVDGEIGHEIPHSPVDNGFDYAEDHVTHMDFHYRKGKGLRVIPHPYWTLHQSAFAAADDIAEEVRKNAGKEDGMVAYCPEVGPSWVDDGRSGRYITIRFPSDCQTREAVIRHILEEFSAGAMAVISSVQ